MGVFFLNIPHNALKYLRHPLRQSGKREGTPIPFHRLPPTQQLHYIKFMWWEDKNLLTFCWPYRHGNLCRHYKSHISSDFYIQNLMLQSPKPNVKSSWWVKPWHQFRFQARWLAVDGGSSGAQRLGFTLHLTWGAFFFFFAICYWGLWIKTISRGPYVTRNAWWKLNGKKLPHITGWCITNIIKSE